MNISHDDIRETLRPISDTVYFDWVVNAVIEMIANSMGGPRGGAYLAGQLKYQGASCIHGHDGTRLVSNRLCVTCSKGVGDAPRFREPRRLSAMGKGKITYLSEKLCPKCGTRRRYVKRAVCVNCSEAHVKKTRAKKELAE